MLRLMLVVALLGVAVYLCVRVIQRRGIRPPPRKKAEPPRPLGPDDDPDFLRDLDKKKKHPEDPDTGY